MSIPVRGHSRGIDTAAKAIPRRLCLSNLPCPLGKKNRKYRSKIKSPFPDSKHQIYPYIVEPGKLQGNRPWDDFHKMKGGAEQMICRRSQGRDIIQKMMNLNIMQSFPNIFIKNLYIRTFRRLFGFFSQTSCRQALFRMVTSY